MSFYRIKKIKNIEYAYLVKNKWTKKGARQKVSKYLGKLIRLEQVKELEFTDFIKKDLQEFNDDNTPSQIADFLIEFELLKHGFKKIKDTLTFGDVQYSKRKIKSSSPVVYFFNDGFFCAQSVKDIFSFDYLGEDSVTATKLAETFVGAGINIPPEVFIHFFKKIYKKDASSKILP